ncbi:MAG: SigE family RNA polymerase sigma factor [Dermatophilaceae bacterium]
MDDEEAYREFSTYVRARQRALVRFAYLISGNAHEAEDLVQSALARVYRRWDAIHTGPDAYVRRTIVNENASRWRRAWRHREVVDSGLVQVLDPPASEPSGPDADLWSRIQRLPRQQRAVVVLRYYEDLTEAQTAQVLGCSVGTVKSHSSRALTALRTAMQEVQG